MAALALLGQVAYLDALYWNVLGLANLTHGSLRPALLSAVVTGAVVSLVSGALGASMAFRKDAREGARPLGLALSVWAYLLAYSGMIVLAAPAGDSPLRPVFDAHFLWVEAIGLAALIRFTSIFPEPLAPEDLQDPEALPIGLRTAQRLRHWLLTPPAPWIAALVVSALCMAVNAAMGRRLQDTALLALTDLFRLVALALVVLNLRHAFISPRADARRRLLWIVLGFTGLIGAVGFVLGGNVLTAVTGWELPGMNWRPIVLNVGVLALLWGASMSVFYRGPMEPGHIVRQSAILAGMGTLTLFLAGGLEMLLAGVVGARFSMPFGAGTLLAAVTMSLVYGRTRGPLDRFLSQTWTDVAPTVDEYVRERPVA